LIDASRGDPKDTAEIKGVVFNIQRYSIQDGPGIRTTVFFKGCPLKCAWCSNPESQSYKPEIVHRDSLCTKCGHCLDVCETKALSLTEKAVMIDRQLCNNCGKCVDVCIAGALKVFGETMTVGQVFKQVKKDEEFYRNSSGGVTVSGGEPLAQADFVAALFKLCKANGIHTCIETSGLTTAAAFQKVIPYTSLILFDIKLSDSYDHQKWTGQPNVDILHNLLSVSASGVPVIIRVPIIPGVNDSQKELTSIGMIALRVLGSKKEINLLPYHKFGMGKYQMLDKEYTLTDLNSLKETDILEHKELMESLGLYCQIVA
jgi:pyruvate formate lyase activating enzyme